MELQLHCFAMFLMKCHILRKNIHTSVMIANSFCTMNQHSTGFQPDRYTFGHEIVRIIENTLVLTFLFNIWCSPYHWNFFYEFLIDECVAIDFVLTKHVCICVCLFISAKHLSCIFHSTVKYELNVSCFCISFPKRSLSPHWNVYSCSSLGFTD